MTMRDMIREFNDRGFSAKSRYIPEEGCYEFTIKKDSKKCKVYFDYPNGATVAETHNIQCRFIENSIKIFHNETPVNQLRQYISKIRSMCGSEKRIFYFICAGTGIPDELCIEQFKNTTITVIARDGSKWRNGERL